MAASGRGSRSNAVLLDGCSPRVSGGNDEGFGTIDVYVFYSPFASIPLASNLEFFFFSIAGKRS